MEQKRNDPMPCSQPHLADLFPLYINGNVEPEDKQRIEDHLSECEKCQDDVRFFLDLQASGRDYKTLPIGSPSEYGLCGKE